MSVTIRLSRHGKKNQPTYRILVCETRSKRDGKFIELLGSFNPGVNPPALTLDKQKFDSWIKNGAIVSSGLKKILISVK